MTDPEEVVSKTVRPLSLLFVPLLGVTLFVGACAVASTQARSQVDPEARSKKFGHVMVVGEFGDIGARQDAEVACVNALRRNSHQATTSTRLFFAGRTYSQAEIQKTLDDAGIDAVLILSPTEAGSASTWIPQTQTTEAAAGVAGNTVVGAARTTTSGGYSVSKPWARFHASLFDRSVGRSVWIASFDSGGNAFAGHNDLLVSMAKKAGSALSQQGLLR